MKTIKAIFFDIDGTLLTSQGHIRQSTRQAIETAQSQGIFCGVATGRAPFEIERLIKDLPIDVCVSYNGSLVEMAEVSIYERTFSTERLEELAVFMAKQKKQIIFETKTQKIGSWSIRVGHKRPFSTWLPLLSKWLPLEQTGRLLSYFKTKNVPKKIQRLLSSQEKVYQCVVLTTTKEEIRLLQLDYVDVLRSNPYSVDIVPKDGNKIVGIQMFGRFTNISLEEIMVFGDHENDMGMLQAAGIGVAMGNASPRVKAVADYVTKSNQDDGICEAMEHFGLLHTKPLPNGLSSH
ncbi:HAD-IIB family hydrolase [Enterococcus bulliens]